MAERYGEELIDYAYKDALRPFHAVGLCARGSVAAETGYHWFVPELLRVKGELRGSGDRAEVEDLFRRSMSLAHEQQALYWALSAAISLAELLHGQHREAEARAVLGPVYNRFTEGFSAAKMERAKLLLDALG